MFQRPGLASWEQPHAVAKTASANRIAFLNDAERRFRAPSPWEEEREGAEYLEKIAPELRDLVNGAPASAEAEELDSPHAIRKASEPDDFQKLFSGTFRSQDPFERMADLFIERIFRKSSATLPTNADLLRKRWQEKTALRERLEKMLAQLTPFFSDDEEERARKAMNALDLEAFTEICSRAVERAKQAA